MPLLWKEGKHTKISQLVNQHLHSSQKRRKASYLVVETGFPTSLIDLFIKNRERLKKSTNKKKRPSCVPPPSPPPINDYNDVIKACPTPYPSPMSSPPRVAPTSSGVPLGTCDEIGTTIQRRRLAAGPGKDDTHRNDGPTSSGVIVNETVQDSDFFEEKRKRRGVSANGIFVAVLKLLFVVVLLLALGVKRLALGVTLSAFLLFLLDSVEKRVSGSWRLDTDNCDDSVMNRGDSFACLKRSSHNIQESQTVEPNDYRAEEQERLDNERRISCDLKEVAMEREASSMYCGVEEFKRRARRDKIKSKMKKVFVSKKLKISKKEEQQHLERLENIAFSKEQHELDQSSKDEKASDINNNSYNKLSSNTNEESGLVWRYTILVLIVLIGLVGGRAIALLLTLSWCLLIKLRETLVPRFIKVVYNRVL